MHKIHHCMEVSIWALCRKWVWGGGGVPISPCPWYLASRPFCRNYKKETGRWWLVCCVWKGLWALRKAFLLLRLSVQWTNLGTGVSAGKIPKGKWIGRICFRGDSPLIPQSKYVITFSLWRPISNMSQRGQDGGRRCEKEAIRQSCESENVTIFI